MGNLQRERKFVPLRVKDPVDQTERRCEHFAEYGSAAHALSYFRGNENIPSVCDPILAALLKEDAVASLGENLHWKLTLNDYKASTEDALAEAGGALSLGTRTWRRTARSRPSRRCSRWRSWSSRPTRTSPRTRRRRGSWQSRELWCCCRATRGGNGSTARCPILTRRARRGFLSCSGARR